MHESVCGRSSELGCTYSRLTVLPLVSHQHNLCPRLIGQTHHILIHLCFKVWGFSFDVTLLITYTPRAIKKYSYENSSGPIMFKLPIQKREQFYSTKSMYDNLTLVTSVEFVGVTGLQASKTKKNPTVAGWSSCKKVCNKKNTKMMISPLSSLLILFLHSFMSLIISTNVIVLSIAVD